MMSEPTAKLTADIDYNLKVDFVRKLSLEGRSQRFVLEKLITSYIAETEETAPKGFPKKRGETTTIRRRAEQ